MSDKNHMQKISAIDKFHMKHFIKEVESIRGRHTELISVYIPSGYDINGKISQIQQEQGTATNIKSKSTRDNVIASLEKMVQHLKQFKQTPPNGLVAFAGNAAIRDGQQDYRVWSVEPPVPSKQNLYRCDKEFVIEPLKEMIDDKIIFGIVVMDKREGNIAILKGKTLIPLKGLQSAVPGKHKTGGQSAQRFERLRQGAAVEFYKRIAGYMNEEFLDSQTQLQGIIIGGPGHTKFEFADGNFINETLKRKILGIKDLSYTGEFGLQELVDKSEDLLAEEEVVHERQLMQDFFKHIATNTGKAAYGYDDLLKFLAMGAVDTVIVSEALEEEKIIAIEEAAEPTGSNVELVSVETREGVQLRDMGKVAGILRYPVQ